MGAASQTDSQYPSCLLFSASYDVLAPWGLTDLGRDHDTALPCPTQQHCTGHPAVIKWDLSKPRRETHQDSWNQTDRVGVTGQAQHAGLNRPGGKPQPAVSHPTDIMQLVRLASWMTLPKCLSLQHPSRKGAPSGADALHRRHKRDPVSKR